MAKKPTEPAAAPTLGTPGYYGDLIRRAWQQIRSNPAPALLYVIVYALASVASQLVQQGTSVTSEHYRTYESIVSVIFIATLPLYGLALADKQRMEISDFTYIQPKLFFYAIGSSLLFGTLIILSAFALFIPLIWIVGWFALTLYAVVDKDLTPISGMKLSKSLSENNKRQIWGVSGVILLLAIPLVLLTGVPYVGSIGVGLFAIMSTALYANVYRDLQEAAV